MGGGGHVSCRLVDPCASTASKTLREQAELSLWLFRINAVKQPNFVQQLARSYSTAV